MTNEQIKLIKDSWEHVVSTSGNPGELFYKRLFQIAPSIRNLFKDDIGPQAEKLTDTLSYVVFNIDSLDKIMTDLEELAVRHKKYGALAEHYPVVNEALIYTIKTSLKEQWTSAHDFAWKECLGIISDKMTEKV